MEEKRESGIMYRSFVEAGRFLTDEQRGKYYSLIFNYMFDFILGESDDPTVNAMFMLISPQIQANIRKYKNGKEPKLKQNESKTEAKQKQVESKTEGNDNVNDNDNDNKNDKEKKKEKKSFIPPSLDDVKQYFQEKGYTDYGAKKAFDYYDVAGWKDSNEKQIKNWKQKMISVWFKREYEITKPKGIKITESIEDLSELAY